MRPYDFLEFRSELKPASGFQSRQFREIEYISGAKDPQYLHTFEDETHHQATLRERLEQPTIWDGFVALLRARGMTTSRDADIIQSVIQIQRDPALNDLNDLVEALIKYDLLWSLWRRRHVLMVERMIGAKAGTGQKTVARVVGEAAAPAPGPMREVEYFTGVGYLHTTLTKKFFPLLWEAQTGLER
jgi:tryptophan 2,3-dioxygenase